LADLVEAGLDITIQNPFWRRAFGQQLKAAADGIVSGSAFPETVGVPGWAAWSSLPAVLRTAVRAERVKRLASHRDGCEGRIAHLKREYGGGRSRLKGEDGARIWASWTGLAYNLDTVSRLPVKPSL
jgi:hypothetical protein